MKGRACLRVLMVPAQRPRGGTNQGGKRMFATSKFLVLWGGKLGSKNAPGARGMRWGKDMQRSYLRKDFM